MTLHVVTIVGPTACGKTALAVEVANHIGSEIVSADSRQVYRGLDIGTGKDLEEYSAVEPVVPYHLIDIVGPEEIYSLFRFQEDCYDVLDGLACRPQFSESKIPALLVGGTGLYLDAVIRDYRIADVPVNRELRARLEDLERDELLVRLQQMAPEMIESIDSTTRRRLIRALEIAEHGKTAKVHYSRGPTAAYRFTVFGIRVDREILRRRIGLRLRQRLEGGLIEEVRGLLNDGLSPQRLFDLGLEYREVAAYLLGKKNREAMVKDLERAINRFAKRQETWFRGMENRGLRIQWIGPDDAGVVIRGSGYEN